MAVNFILFRAMYAENTEYETNTNSYVLILNALRFYRSYLRWIYAEKVYAIPLNEFPTERFFWNRQIKNKTKGKKIIQIFNLR